MPCKHEARGIGKHPGAPRIPEPEELRASILCKIDAIERKAALEVEADGAVSFPICVVRRRGA